jgi:pyrimidine deaminase RibD-like protein
MNRKPSLSKELQAAEHFVRLAMAQADLAVQSGNAPFGAVIVDTLGNVAASEHNRVRETLDPSAHAEINAIRVACGRVRRATLEGYRLYVNKEPRGDRQRPGRILFRGRRAGVRTPAQGSVDEGVSASFKTC